MNDSRDVTTPTFSVGDLVQLRRGRGATVTGRLVEDFGRYLVPADRLGRDWASPQRWAIAAEDGTLIFADDDDLTAVPTTGIAPADTPTAGGSVVTDRS
ncbi:hypothetical protein ACFULT_08035 [Rhodococcus sp. NPDC057297]|uniref:hypothetical protein n=1 Tax=Rhodococcus sp. NPDC057297 TaxID=3346090 RepID=UPI00363A200A